MMGLFRRVVHHLFEQRQIITETCTDIDDPSFVEFEFQNRLFVIYNVTLEHYMLYIH